jgi:hypothetical protein
MGLVTIKEMFKKEVRHSVRSGLCDSVQVGKFLKLMDKYSIPKRKVLNLIYKNIITFGGLVDFVIHMDFIYSGYAGSKHMKWYLMEYAELRNKGSSHYKCKILI